jgi:hypothetical protein
LVSFLNDYLLVSVTQSLCNIKGTTAGCNGPDDCPYGQLPG